MSTENTSGQPSGISGWRSSHFEILLRSEKECRTTLRSGTQPIARQELYCVTTINAGQDHPNRSPREYLFFTKREQCLICEKDKTNSIISLA